MADEGEPLSEGDKASQDPLQKAFEKVEKEQVDEDAKLGSQHKDASDDLFPPEKPPSREK